MSYVNILIRSLLVFLLFTSSARAASVSLNSTGNPTVFSIDGVGMDGVAGIQLDITYDAASLSTPKATQGGLVSGAMFAANTTSPGLIKIAIISTRPFSGSGQIATITFASKTGNGGITLINPHLIDSKGSEVSSSTGAPSSEPVAPGAVLPPGVPFSQTTQTTQTSQVGATTIPIYSGTITLPTDQQRIDVKPAPSPAPSPSAVEAAPAAAVSPEPAQPNVASVTEAKVEETPQYVVYKGVLERFKQYKGRKNLPDMAMLFNKNIAQTIVQEPAILLSNGQKSATLTINIPARIASSPNFAANGGRLISFKQDKQSKGRWTVEILPEAGALRVTVTIVVGAEEFEYPLTVAPPVKTALTLDEHGWHRFLKEVGTPTAPLHDLNNDGVRDFIDEYIFVANHLAGKATPVKPAGQ